MNETTVDTTGQNQMDFLADATRQRAIMIVLLLYILVIVAAMFVPVIRANESLIMIVVGLAMIFFAARLCWVLYGKVFASLLTVLCFVPYVNILIVLMISSRATRILKGEGFKVGLLGANIKNIAASS